MNSSAIPVASTIISRQGLLFFAFALVLHMLVLYGLDTSRVEEKPRIKESAIAVQLREIMAQPEIQTSQQHSEAKVVSKIPMPPSIMRNADKSVITQELASLEGSSYQNPSAISQADEMLAAASTEIKVAQAPEQQADPVALPTNEAPAYVLRPPPSGQISMRIVRTENNRNPTYGEGEIIWDLQGTHYKMTVSAALNLLVTSLNLYKLQSEGTIGLYGITPAISTEARRNRSETATHFDHEAKTVSFSSSNKTAAVEKGVQDKASVLMQLAAIAYAEPEKFQAGREITLQVAEERDLNTFTFVVSGLEEIDTKSGMVKAWHVVRPPRPGSYNSRLEVWLAPEYYWFPVQIRNTESNGAVTTQTMTKIAGTNTGNSTNTGR
ncbi:DUF3108 domain-containing protein [Undibacterium sp. TJN19]|uniref:DUF3108 domain-containing protein n=1 Tax=Undibacterium sp. TJN19 TaxID=3413055 RepID=UPI003BF38AB5